MHMMLTQRVSLHLRLFLLHQRTPSALACVQKHGNDVLVFKHIYSARLSHGRSILGHAEIRSGFLPFEGFSPSPFGFLGCVDRRLVSFFQSRALRLQSCPHHATKVLYNGQSVFQCSNHAQFSTRPSANRVKNLMIATWVSAAFGVVLLTAIGFRFYGRFKKRARGIEEIDIPQCGRRNRLLSRYRGYAIPSIIIDCVADHLPWFEVRPDDVWVVGFPKSGNTWLQEIVYLVSTDCDFEKAKATHVDERFPYLEYPFPGIREISKMDSPRFIKTHVPFSLLPKQFKEKKPKVIYIARNPKDTVVSLQAFQDLVNVFKFTGTMEDFAQLFVEGTVIYGPWTKHVQEAWEQRNEDNVLFVTYENLHKDFRGTVQAIARFLGKSLTESQLVELEQHCSFLNMRSNDSVNYSWMKGIWKEGQFMRKGKVGDWKDHLSPEMSAKFDSMAKSLESVGLHLEDS